MVACEIAKNLREAIYTELGFKASAGISYNKMLAKAASAANKPFAQTTVPVRYVDLVMKRTPIAKVRNLGGKISENLHSYGLHKMKELQEKTIPELSEMAELDYAKAEWIRNLSFGICVEPMMVKSMPNCASGIKTFKPAKTFEELEKFIRLCVMDVNQKVDEFIDEQNIFPTQFIVSYRDRFDNGK